MANPAYDPNDTDQGDLLDLLEYRVDEVTAEQQTIGLNRETAYREAVEATRQMMRQAPAAFIDRLTVRSTNAGVTAGAGFSVVQLPADFLRFRSVKLADWKREITNLIPYGSDAWRLQFNSYSRADTFNPAASMKPNGATETDASDGAIQELQCWPADSQDALDYLVYWPDDLAPETVPDEHLDVVVYLAAARVLSNERSYGERDQLIAKANQIVGGNRFGITGEASSE